MRSLLTKLLPSGTSRDETLPPPRSAADPEKILSRATWGWALTSEQIQHETQNGLIPMTLPADPVPHTSAMHLWLSWHDQSVREGEREAGGQLHWLPVGRFGPVLMLGHFNPRHPEAIAPVSTGYFQPVLLTPEAYNHYYKRCAERAAELKVKPPAEVTASLPARNRFPEDLPIVCDGARDALRFILDHYILLEKEVNRIEGLLEKPSLGFGDLPTGLRSAVSFLCRKPVADLTLWQVTNNAEELVPASMRKSARALAEIPGNLWIGVQDYLPQSAVDEINHHLSEFRQIHQVLYDTDTGRPATTSRSATSFGITKLVQQGANAKKESVTLIIDHSVEKIDPRKATTQPRDIFKWLCWKSAHLGASDLHIEPLLYKGLARARVDGSLVEIFECTEETIQHVIGAAKDICGMGSEMFDLQDKNFSMKIAKDGDESHFTVRAAAAPVRGRLQGLVLRFLKKGGKITKLTELKQPPRIFSALCHAINQEQGTILFCGPTGCGKSTSIAACFDAVNIESLKLVTIEDPVEYEIERVMQMQVDDHRDVGFERLLKGIVRLDPDVALVGEIRDEKSADSAIRLSLTGHLVFATLHTLSAAKAPQRLLGLGLDPEMVAESLIMIVSQRLYPCLCHQCRQTRAPSEREKAIFGKHFWREMPKTVGKRAPGGCEQCHGTGVRGSIAAMEVIRVTAEISELISRRARAHEIEEQARRQGDLPLVTEVLRHAASGLIDVGNATLAAPVWTDGWDAKET